MKLTRRQQEFIKNMVELGNEMDGPIHYSQLAKRIGVSPFTAYDMLRVLEKKGLVTSEYQLAADKSGPGRAERLFYPTPVARKLQQVLSQTSKEALALEGEDLKQFLLQKIHTGEIPDDGLGLEMLARIPPMDQGQIAYCLEVMTVITLNLRYHAKYKVFADHLTNILPDNTQANRINLSLLAGFALGILAEADSDDPEWTQILFEHVHQYVEIVLMLDEAECQELGSHLVESFRCLASGKFLS